MRDTVLIAGGGKMGCGIAAVSALAGNPTAVYDQFPDARRCVLDNVRSSLEELVGYGLCTGRDAEDAAGRITVLNCLEAGFAGCKLVIEAIFENLAAKQELFALLDKNLPVGVPLLSNTSGLRITDIAAQTHHPERTLTTHFWLPAHLIPLVEVVIGERSDPELAEEISAMLGSWGKAPVVVKKDLPGQLANRILQAIIRESVNIVEMGLASAEDVDTAVKMGMALRFPVWGPLEHVDAVGFDICGPVQDTVLPEISARREASPFFAQSIAAGHLGYKTGQGFYDWSRKSMEELVRRRNDFIVHSLKKIREDL